jgi:nicotinamidase-related amidase
MIDQVLAKSSTRFLEWLVGWKQSLKELPLDDIDTKGERMALLSVDLIWGFCRQGSLASKRVADIVPSVVALFEKMHHHGVKNYILFQDSHSEDSTQFESYGPHCVSGSKEAETIPELQDLEFSGDFTVEPKNSISSSIGTGLKSWLEKHAEVGTFIVVGDCTDLCVYQLAMYLRLEANASGRKREVVVPANCVDTYHLPVESTEDAGVMPHDGELMHLVFLYHMALNGIRVVAGID